MTDMQQIAGNIQDDTQAPGQMGVNQEMVSQISERIKEALPSIQQMGQFESMLQQNQQLAQLLVKICPELIMAFVSVAQELQQNSTTPDGQQQQSGMSPPGGDEGASAPDVGADDLPAPAATTTGNPPPSVPGASSPLRKQFYKGK